MNVNVSLVAKDLCYKHFTTFDEFTRKSFLSRNIKFL